MRCWIVGNGKSLNETPLELLNGEVTFGVNRIHRFYDRTSWRPLIYVRTEIDNLDWRDAVAWHVDQGIRCYLSHSIANTVTAIRKPMWPVDNVISLNTSCQHLRSNFYNGNRPESWHFPQLCCYGSVGNIAAQIAVLEKFNPIIFVGMDLGYSDSREDHFDEDYGEWGEMAYEERHDTEVHMHEIIKKECDQRGITVLNATVGGELEVYPRVDIMEALDEQLD